MNLTKLPKISPEEKEIIGKEVLTEAWSITMRAFIDTLGGGETALREIRPYMQNAGSAFSQNMMRMYDIESDGLERIAIITALAEYFLEIEAKEVEHSDERIVRICEDCIYSKNQLVESCKMGHEMWLDFIAKALDPDYSCRFTQMIPAGDHFCSWVIEKRKNE